MPPKNGNSGWTVVKNTPNAKPKAPQPKVDKKATTDIKQKVEGAKQERKEHVRAITGEKPRPKQDRPKLVKDGENKPRPKRENTGPRVKPLCRQFKEGKCEFGEKCRFAHDLSAPESVPRPKRSANGERPERTERAPRPKLPCRDFAAGKCEYGEKCRFSHEAKAE